MQRRATHNSMYEKGCMSTIRAQEKSKTCQKRKCCAKLARNQSLHRINGQRNCLVHFTDQVLYAGEVEWHLRPLEAASHPLCSSFLASDLTPSESFSAH